MSKTETDNVALLVAVVTVEGNISDVELISTLTEVGLGTHQAVEEAFREKVKDCFVIGKVVAISKACSLNGIQKLIIREIPPKGFMENIFALFIMGKVAEHLNQFTVNTDDMLIIHQPHIMRSCLINFSSLQSHPYELQVICGHSSESENIPSAGVFLQLIKLKVPEVVERVPHAIEKVPGEKEMSPDETVKRCEDTAKAPDETVKRCEDSAKVPGETEKAPDETGKVPSVIETVPGQHSNNSTQEESTLRVKRESLRRGVSAEVANASGFVTPVKPRRGRRKLMNNDEYSHLKVLPKELEKQSKRFLTRFGEITRSCTKANIIGIIISVEKGCQCMEEKEHLVIHLQDEGSSGKNFVLNVGCSITEIPPLHVNYILRAINVLVLYENDVATGWVTKGNLLATVDSDCEKPISLLSVEESCTLSVEEEERIYELRNFVKASFSLGDLSTQSEGSSYSLVNENGSQDVSAAIDPVITKVEEPVALHLDSSIKSEQNEMNVSASKMEEGFKKQRVALQLLSTFLNRLPTDLRSLAKEYEGESIVYKCLKCGEVSHPPAGVSTRRSSPRSMEMVRRKHPNGVERINSEIKRLRRIVKSALVATIPESKPL